jgi:hypothetical protein
MAPVKGDTVTRSDKSLDVTDANSDAGYGDTSDSPPIGASLLSLGGGTQAMTARGLKPRSTRVRARKPAMEAIKKWSR